LTLAAMALLLVTGLFAGFIGGLFGIGGGIVIVPALYAVFSAFEIPDDIRIKMALGTSLATIIVTSVRSVQRHHRHGAVEWPLLRSWAPWIGGGALIGALIARIADARALTFIFGCALLAIAVQRVMSGKMTDGSAGLPRRRSQFALASGTGLVSSLLGIGGGVLGVIILTRAGRSVHRAIGTAAGFGLAIAVPGTIGYMISGWGQGAGMTAIGYVSLSAFAVVAIGTFLAAPIGATTASRLDSRLLTRLFAAYAALTGVLMIREGLVG
jgi:uncharacterized membrane protein YfcA